MSNYKDLLNIYDFSCKLPGSGEKVQFKPVTTSQLKRLLIYEDEDDPMIIEDALDEIITTSVISEDFDIDKLILQDRFYLLLDIRKKTKGNSYTFTYTCPKCKSQSMQSINLNELPVNTIPEDIDPFIRVNNKMKLRLDYLTRGEQKEINQLIKADKSIDSDIKRIAELSILHHASGIKEVKAGKDNIDNLPLTEKKYIVENVPSAIYAQIKEWFADNDFGVEFEFEIKCNSCDFNEKRAIPMENFFF